MVEKMSKELVKTLGYVCGWCSEVHDMHIYSFKETGKETFFLCPNAPLDPPTRLIQPLTKRVES